MPDSGVLILGKPIKEKPVPLKEVTRRTGLTTVWGDIVRKESVTSKDGKWEIYSIDITDYTSSNTLKIIQSSSKKEAIEELKEGDTLVVRGDASYDKYEHDVTIRPLRGDAGAEIAQDRRRSRSSGWSCTCTPTCPPWTA